MAKKRAKKAKAKRIVRKKERAVRAQAARKPKAAKAMPKAQAKEYKALLLKEREKIGGDLSHITKDALNTSQRDASGDLSGYSFHMADMASDNYERDFSLGRATDEQKRLFAIDEALKRMDEGVYGSCLQCGKAIAKKRLKALPHTELCIECQKQSEH